MRKKLITTLLIIGILLVPTTVAQAATSATVTVYATPSYYSIAVTPTSFTFGGPVGVLDVSQIIYASTNTTSAPSNPIHTSEAPFKLSNNSTVRINVAISTDNWTGGDGWVVSHTATPGANTFGMKAGVNGTDPAAMVLVRKTGPDTLKTGTAVGEDWTFDMQLLTPTSYTDGVVKTGTVTITATVQ